MRPLDIAQLLAAIAVFIGLALVVYELRQTQTLAKAGIMASHWDQNLENHRATLGENPAPTLAKRCLPLSELTNSEKEILRASFDIQMSMVERTRLIEEIMQNGVPWEEYAYHIFRHALSTPIGKHDYHGRISFDEQTGEEGVVDGWPIEYQPTVSRILDEGVPECGVYWLENEDI